MAPNDISSTDVQSIIKQFQKWFFEESPENLNLLITGKTGVGKSRLVNALVGKRVAQEGRRKNPCTSEVTSYQVDIDGVPVTVWDSPGLQDGTTNEDRYIQDMKDKIKDIALMIYCVKMDDARFYDADKKAIQTLTEVFGKEVWNHAVVALTFANKVEDPDEEDELEYFQSQLKEWKKQLNKYFKTVGLNPKTLSSIPVIPVGNKTKSMRLPDRENWLADMWIECYQAMKASARPGMYRINQDRVKSESSAKKSTPAAATSTVTANDCDTDSDTSTGYTTTYDQDIPREITLNEQQQKRFVSSSWEAFVTVCGEASRLLSTVVYTIGSKILKSIGSLFF